MAWLKQAPRPWLPVLYPGEREEGQVLWMWGSLESPGPPSAPGSKALSNSHTEWGGRKGVRTRRVCVCVCVSVQVCVAGMCLGGHAGLPVCPTCSEGKDNIVGVFFYVPKLPP